MKSLRLAEGYKSGFTVKASLLQFPLGGKEKKIS